MGGVGLGFALPSSSDSSARVAGRFGGKRPPNGCPACCLEYAGCASGANNGLTYRKPFKNALGALFGA